MPWSVEEVRLEKDSVQGNVDGFDWHEVLNIPKRAGGKPGKQVMHFSSADKPYEQNERAKLFVKKYLSEGAPLTSDAEVLKYGSDSVKLKGLFIELGVCTGRTINFIAALNPHQTIYGFDSFEGLPEEWIRGDIAFPAGTYGFKNPNTLPPVLHNVTLIKGMFSDTLVNFVNAVDAKEKIAFLHVDCDIYSSTSTAFQILGPKIKSGTVIVFDELYNYSNYENHEFKAFEEFLDNSGLAARTLAYNINHEQVAVQITEKSQASLKI